MTSWASNEGVDRFLSYGQQKYIFQLLMDHGHNKKNIKCPKYYKNLTMWSIPSFYCPFYGRVIKLWQMVWKRVRVGPTINFCFTIALGNHIPYRIGFQSSTANKNNNNRYRTLNIDWIHREWESYFGFDRRRRSTLEVNPNPFDPLRTSITRLSYLFIACKGLRRRRIRAHHFTSHHPGYDDDHPS